MFGKPDKPLKEDLRETILEAIDNPETLHEMWRGCIVRVPRPEDKSIRVDGTFDIDHVIEKVIKTFKRHGYQMR
jgi:hypothetical protein